MAHSASGQPREGDALKEACENFLRIVCSLFARASSHRSTSTDGEGEIIGQHFSRFYTEEDRAIDLPETALRTAREEGRFEQEGWRVRKDGARFWAHVVIDPIRDFEGNLVGYAKITRDLSERRKAELQLRESQEQFRLLVQSVTDYALYMLDLDRRVSSWNAGAERIKGYTRDEILGHHFSRFYTEEEREAGSPAKACNRRRPRAVGRRKAGGYGRTAAASGRTWLSTPFAMMLAS